MIVLTMKRGGGYTPPCNVQTICSRSQVSGLSQISELKSQVSCVDDGDDDEGDDDDADDDDDDAEIW